MDGEMNENLEYLDQVLDELEPSAGEMLILFNHLVGWTSAYIPKELWLMGVARALDALHAHRAMRP
jgi:hypothetical protein